MKRVPIILQFAAVLFIIIAILTIILTTYSSNLIVDYSEQAIAESSMSSLEASRRLNENAVENIAKATVRLASTYNFAQFRNYPDYESLRSNYSYMSEVQNLHHELKFIKSSFDGIHSVCFYLDESDYIVATDSGIAQIQPREAVGWIPKDPDEDKTIYGKWYHRSTLGAASQTFLSFVLPLNRLTTSAKGTIIVNLQERQIAEHLQPSSEYSVNRLSILVDQDGIILSHPDKSLLFENSSTLPHIADLLGREELSGYSYLETQGERQLYTFVKSKETGWTYIGIYSMDFLTAQADAARQSMNLTMIVMIIFGAMLAVFAAVWMSHPARKLARAVRDAKALDMPIKNELAFLSSAFIQIQQEEEMLSRRLKQHEQDSESILLLALLRGDIDKSVSGEAVERIFPHPMYITSVIVIDEYSSYVGATNAEMRMYHRLLFLPKCEAAFQDGIQGRCVYRGEGTFGLIVNFENGNAVAAVSETMKAIASVKDFAKDIFGKTVTIGVSEICDTYCDIFLRAADALEATKRRIVHGSNSIIHWKPEYGRSIKYIYPVNSEQRIINYLSANNIGMINQELKEIRNMIVSEEYVSFDNILFIYNQIVGAAIKYLGENNIGTSRVFAYRGNVYAAVASFDTLEEIEKYMQGFFEDILSFLHYQDDSGIPSRILRYLNEHYREDIVFEEMASRIGISYSYMRRLVKEVTGKSIIDYINALRIQDAKRLLKETDMGIAQIAHEVGYRNIQSLNRFFRKYEGMSPSEYKNKN